MSRRHDPSVRHARPQSHVGMARPVQGAGAERTMKPLPVLLAFPRSRAILRPRTYFVGSVEPNLALQTIHRGSRSALTRLRKSGARRVLSQLGGYRKLGSTDIKSDIKQWLSK